MITWILSYWQGLKSSSEVGAPDPSVSFAVGVGNIPGLDKTGQWSASGQYFVAEADEYVIDPSAPSRGEPITPRFSFMKPAITVCTNLVFDHPDVYTDFDHTLAVFGTFFSQIRPGGILVAADHNRPYLEQLEQDFKLPETILYYGQDEESDLQLITYRSQAGVTTATFISQEREYSLTLHLPGLFNVMNALAALSVAQSLQIPLEQACQALSSFRSTQRRSEYIGEKNGVKYYDDYAHHPQEVKNVIHAFKEWFPHQKVVVAFQAHTFSRTKALFADFVDAFAEADQVVMIDIFASAREAFDSSITSDMLCQAIMAKYPDVPAQNLQTLPQLAEWCQTHLQAGDVCLTLGAGDIYHLHQLV
jgi:UDP-N-acetylmuramate--alanine ligase